MEIGVADLAEIFEDPLLNDLADNFLNDIDIHELGDFSSECAVDQTDPSLPSDSFAKSNHATLEALLKSQPLRTCVPPAPDLQSGINMATKTGPSPKIHSHFNSWDPRQQRNGSNPILIPQYTANKPKTEAIRISPRSRLICDYLGKCPGDSNTRYPPIQKSEADFSQQNSDSVRSESTDWDYPSNERRASHVSKSFRIQGSNVVWSSSPLSENGESLQ
ncbi:hypothetical protein D915_006701 [Fasciola hepatica]|uniref:Uncharacterized protein n=1 Tax=Fasciola hepatica TaxID=6192 RepID=A0A2H1C633_FASHE|nr:hypothetical protein D915_006701 [Fasciola hepatica]